MVDPHTSVPRAPEMTFARRVIVFVVAFAVAATGAISASGESGMALVGLSSRSRPVKKKK